MHDDPAILARGLVFGYTHQKTIDKLDLSVPKGTSFGLLGPNGSGKTTLIRLLAGILRPQTGQLSILGQKPSTTLSRQIGYMPQLPALYNELSISENITFFAQIYGLQKRNELRQRVEEVVRLIDLWDKRGEQVMNLSGGMKQRVSLACALVHKPRLLFLDEPTVGLDPELRVVFWEHFRELTHQGTTLIISSHTMDDAAHCDRLAFLRRGQVIAEGTPRELITATGSPGANLEEAFLYYARKGEKRNVF